MCVNANALLRSWMLLAAFGGSYAPDLSKTTVHWVCCVALPCLFVCLTLLASFFLPSHLSLKTCIWNRVCHKFGGACIAPGTTQCVQYIFALLLLLLHVNPAYKSHFTRHTHTFLCLSLKARTEASVSSSTCLSFSMTATSTCVCNNVYPYEMHVQYTIMYTCISLVPRLSPLAFYSHRMLFIDHSSCTCDRHIHVGTLPLFSLK